MRRVMQVWMAFVVLGAALTGCGETASRERVCTERGRVPPKPERREGAPADVFLTGLVLHDVVSSKDYFVDLTKISSNGVAIAPNLPLLFNHEMKLHVRQKCGDDPDKAHDYQVLFGPDPKHDLYGQLEIKTSAATAYISAGWALVIGKIPLAKSEWVDTSSDTTQWVLRIAGDGQHYVYNLEPRGSRCQVKVVPVHGEPVWLEPGKLVKVSATAISSPDRFADDDPFVAFVRQRAAVAGIRLCK